MINLFGRPCVAINNKKIRELPAKAYLVVALLCQKPDKKAQRSTLASWLWENSTTKQAFANLRQLLAKVRQFEQTHNISILERDDHFIRLSPCLKVDLKDFSAINNLKTPQELSCFVKHYAAGFLSEFNDIPGEELNICISSYQKQYDERFLSIALKGEALVEPEQAIDELKTILNFYPHDEPTCAALLRLYAQKRDWQAIQSTFKQFAYQLRQNLDETPSKKFLNLTARLSPEIIPYLQKSFDCFSNSQPYFFNTRQSLPSLILVPHHTLQKTSSNEDNPLVEEITHCLVQLRSFKIVAPAASRSIVPKEDFLLPLNVDFMLSVKHVSGGVNLALTCLHTSEMLLCETRYFNSSVSENFFYIAISKAIENAINAAILDYAGKYDLWPAYRLYLSAGNILKFGDLPGIRSARKKLREALYFLPDFYVAKQMLARTYFLEWLLLGKQDTSLLLRAKMLASDLVKLNPVAAGGHWQLSTAFLYLCDFDEALKHIDIAANLAPDHAEILAHKADVLCHTGRSEQAIDFINQAIVLSPLPPDEFYWIRAGILFLQKRYQEALLDMQKSKDLTAFNWRMLAACHAMLGNSREAALSRSTHMEEYPDFQVSDWEETHLLKNRTDLQHYALALRQAGFS